MSEQKPIDNGGPAFPRTAEIVDRKDDWHMFGEGNEGVTLRDYFAGQALIMHGIGLSQSGFPDWHMEVAKLSYKTADAMIAARKANQ